MFLFAASIYFIVCHGGPADHFSTFADELTARGHEVKIFATGPALEKLQERATPFSVEKCSGASLVITDVSREWDIQGLAYYDNPEAYVPGGYSSIAAKVMREADGILFANANLAKTPIFETPTDEVFLPYEKRVGLGYYPIQQAEKVAKRRVLEREEMRARLFSQWALEDQGQKILVYVGGNNEEYFSKALPAFLGFLEEGAFSEDFIFLFQQHPGAKKEDIDGKMVRGRLRMSNFSSEEAQVVADGILYYQTSLGPQFVLAGIPTIQVGHNVYEDILVKNGLCGTATDGPSFINELAHMQAKEGTEAIRQGLGISSEWVDKLEEAVLFYEKKK